MDTSRRLPVHLARKVAVTADADPRSVFKVYAGEPVRGMAGDRIRAALRELGITPPGPNPGESR